MAVSALRRRSSERGREQAQYHVVLSVDPPTPDEDTVETVRSRMGLLNSAMARITADADDFKIVVADYVQGCLELDVWTHRVRGIREGRVSVMVRRVNAPSA